MNPPNPPTDAALKLATQLAGHISCQNYASGKWQGEVCAGCLGDASTIDTELRLPEKHAALLLAQGVCDGAERNGRRTPLVVEELRTALAQIK